MLRAHYRETPKLQQVDQRRENNGSKEGRKEEKERKEVNEGGTSLPQVPRTKDVPKIENFLKYRNSSTILAGLSYRIFHYSSFTENSARIGRV